MRHVTTGKMFDRTDRRPGLRVWLLRAFVTILLSLLFQWRVGRILPMSGDEPHYVLTSVSLLRDGDANLANNYQEDQAKEFGFPGLQPQGWDIREEVIPAPHGVMFPLLVSGPYSAFGIRGTRVFLILISGVLGILLTAAVCDRLGLPPPVGTWSAVLMAVSPVWQSHASRILPESTAGTVFIGLIWLGLGLLQRDSDAHPRELFFLGAAAASLPILYGKYALLGLAALGLVVTVAGIRRAPFALAGAVVAIGISRLFLMIVSGSPWDTAGGRLSDVLWRGFFERFWRLWLDRGHGLLVYEPWTLLAFWAVPGALFGRGKRRASMWLAGGVAGYALMYSIFPYWPGESMPGRYLVAAIPSLAVLTCSWALTGKGILRTLALGGLGLITAGFGVGAAVMGRPHWELFRGYVELYSSYWPPASFTPAAPVVLDSAANLGALLIALVIVTKVMAAVKPKDLFQWARRNVAGHWLPAVRGRLADLRIWRIFSEQARATGLRIRRSRWTLAVLCLCLSLAYAIAYLALLVRSGSADGSPYWAGAHDQAAYLRSAAALSRLDFNPESHYYPVGYAALAAPFYSLLKAHAFFVPNLLCYLASVYLLYRIFRYFLKPVESLILAALLLTALPMQLRSLLVPCTSIPTQVLLYWAVYRVGLGNDLRRDLRTGGLLCGVMLFFRPANALVCLVLVLIRLFTERHDRAWKAAVTDFGIAAGLVTIVWGGSQLGLYGRLVSPYAETSMTIGFTCQRWLLKLYAVMFRSEVVFPPGCSLSKSFPHILLAGPGILYMVWRRPRLGVPILGAGAAGIGLYLLYNDFWPRGIYRFGLFHYIAWVMPLGGLVAYVSFRHASRALGFPVWLGTLLTPILAWSVLRVEAVSVPVGIAAGSGRIEISGDMGAVDLLYLEDWNETFRFARGGRALRRFEEYVVFDTGSAFVVLFLRPTGAKNLTIETAAYRGDPQLIRAKCLKWRLGWGFRARMRSRLTAPVSQGDFDGDGGRDLLWHQAASGQVTVHFYQGGALRDWRWLRAVGTANWKLVGAADFDGNGTPDLVWEDEASGKTVVHYYAGTNFTGWDWLVDDGRPGMRVIAVADWDTDGHPDLIWEDGNTGRLEVEYRGGPKGTRRLKSATVRAGGIVGWRLAGVADFDGNGTCDLVWENEITRQVTVHYYNGTEMTDWRWLNISGMRGWRLAGVGDLNGDGQPDLIWRNETTDQLTVHYYGGSKGDRLEAWLRLQVGAIQGWRLVVPM